MDNSSYLFAAFSIAWTIIFIYVFRIFRSQKALESQIDKIRDTLREKAT